MFTLFMFTITPWTVPLFRFSFRFLSFHSGPHIPPPALLELSSCPQILYHTTASKGKDGLRTMYPFI